MEGIDGKVKKRKAALVIGASRGIGAAIALALEKGYDVGLNFIAEEEKAQRIRAKIEAFGGKSTCLRADVGKVEDIDAMFEQFLQEFGRIDLLVNNAGISRFKPFLEVEPDFWERITLVNWRGPYFCAQRAALTKFTDNAALELAKYGIRVNAIAPGYTDVGWDRDDPVYEAEDRIPLKRFAEPAEIAHAVLFLEDEHSGYITGECLKIDGGALLPVVPESDS